jgi:dihydrolipoamide dehydrogenase
LSAAANIGMEFASFFSSVGVEVNVIEMMDESCPQWMRILPVLMRKSIDKVSYHLGAKVEAIQGNTVTFSSQGQSASLQAD